MTNSSSPARSNMGNTPLAKSADAPDFDTFFAQVNDGITLDDATRELRRATAELQHVARNQGGNPKARLTVTLDLKLVDGIFEVYGDVTLKAPKPARTRSIFYEHKGSLTANNPKQLALDLARTAEAEGDTSAPRLVG